LTVPGYNEYREEAQLINKIWLTWSLIMIAYASLLVFLSILTLRSVLKTINKQRSALDQDRKTTELNLAVTIVHFSPYLLLFTGGFEIFTAFKQSSAMNNWILIVYSIEFIFIALIDLMICSVFWLIAHDFEKT